MAELVLVLGGVRSGKSAVAEDLVAQAADVVYVATGLTTDAEMTDRIARHRGRRPAGWKTVETLDPAAAVRAAPPGSAVLVDALGPWLAARLDDDRDTLLAEAEALGKAALAHDGGPVVVVAEEAGLGLVPPDAGARRWLDLLGEAKQRLGAAAARTLLVVAGHPLILSTPGPQRYTGRLGQGVHGDRMVPQGALDFAVNVHGGAPPPHIRAALDTALDEAGRYPDDGRATAAVARRHGRPQAEVLVTAGAAEAFHVLARTVSATDALVVHPSFTEPEAALLGAGVPVRHAFRDPANGWLLEHSSVDPAADLVVVGNPNNPTGTLEDPERIAALCRPGRLTVVDEAFMDFVENPDDASLAGRRHLPGLVVVRSVTKLWGLAGVRAGYLLGPEGLIARCAAARPAWATSGIALAAVEACAQDEAYRRSVAAEVAENRRRLGSALAQVPGVRVYDGAANFLLVEVPDGPAVHAALLARGIAVRPSTFPGLSLHHIRVAVRDAATNDRLVVALRAVLAPDA